ncbi:MAG: hypothetical protein ACI4NM_08330 [Bullifex sp.]
MRCLVYSIITYALVITLRLDGDSLFDGRNSFDGSKRSPAFFLFGVLALMSLLILRPYQMSGISVLMWLTPVTVVIFITVEILRRRHYRDFSFQTYWVGAVKSFIMLYSLVYHTSVGNTRMAMLVYLAIAVSSMASGPVRKLMKGKLTGIKLSNACILLSALCSFLLTFSSQAVNMIGIVLAGLFANVAVAEAGDGYMKDERYVPEERGLVRLRIQTAGSVIEQLVLFFTIYVLGEYRIHENLLAPYAAGLPDPEVSLKLRMAGMICSVLLSATAVLIVCIGEIKRRRSANG